ncbi:pur operon repressor [Anaerosalibacter sp. Marseille-P3206]|uniref:pur operon repressor n=1 Tax=Anaerosalibacter sp. Marseille-P3206 TaxID=1871005 RepID=UPI000984AD67|nr:pur operon repressor [Anaerosalibacter sp. Marseille-P3206]
MGKFKRNERIAGLMYIFTNRPNEILTYNYFSKLFNVKKPSISGDIGIMKELVKKLDIGVIETIPGANGGVRFIPGNNKEETKKFLDYLCSELSKKERLIPGGFIYMMDLLNNPQIVKKIGMILADEFIDRDIDYVVTIETKGIPIGLMTAEFLGVPLVIIRKNMRITEGTAVNINYISGSTKTIQTMSLSKRALKEGANVLIVDDFMRAGGTIKGIKEMMGEFNAQVKGIGVLITTLEPEEKLIKGYKALLKLEKVDEVDGEISMSSNFELLRQFK